MTQEFRIDLAPSHVVWRLDRDKAAEIVGYLSVLSDKGSAGHCYADISTPADTLVVSRDEYVNAIYPWESPA